MLTKIIAAVIAVLALRRIYVRYRKGGSISVELVFWGLVFTGVAVAAFYPHSTDILAGWMGIASGTHAVTFLAITFLLLTTFVLVAKVRELDRNLTQLVRALALQQAQNVSPGDPRGDGPHTAESEQRRT